MKLIILTISFFLSTFSFAQNPESKDCYEIKYLDFFGLDNQEIVKWPDSEINGLISMDFENQSNYSTTKTNFIIPTIIYQLREYHPNCNAHIDTNYFEKIFKLYFKIRGIDISKFDDKSLPEKIDYMRNDFYSQVENAKHLPYMIMTFDDGPFHGVDFDHKIDVKPKSIQETKFGFLSIYDIDQKIILSGTDKSGNIIWQKLITGLSNRNLSDLNFLENPIKYTSVAAIAHMYSEGERFTLYLKNDGQFMFYFHS